MPQWRIAKAPKQFSLTLAAKPTAPFGGHYSGVNHGNNSCSRHRAKSILQANAPNDAGRLLHATSARKACGDGGKDGGSWASACVLLALNSEAPPGCGVAEAVPPGPVLGHWRAVDGNPKGARSSRSEAAPSEEAAGLLYLINPPPPLGGTTLESIMPYIADAPIFNICEFSTNRCIHCTALFTECEKNKLVCPAYTSQKAGEYWRDFVKRRNKEALKWRKLNNK